MTKLSLATNLSLVLLWVLIVLPPLTTLVVSAESTASSSSSILHHVTAYLRLNGNSITVDPANNLLLGATGTPLVSSIHGMPVVTITSSGVYSISGSLDNGQIRVDTSATSENEQVVLLLNGTRIHSSFTSPILVVNADKTIISLLEGTENHISDGNSYSVFLDDDSEEEPNAAIFAKDDIEIVGRGTLVVEGNYNHGIATNDDLKIKGANSIHITAVNDGIRGRDSIQISSSASTMITINAKDGDGMQSNKGYISIEGDNTHLQVNAAKDGIKADSSISILGGNITIVTGGGNNNNNDDEGSITTQNQKNEQEDSSAKGIRADGDITIHNGTFYIDSADDTIHTNGKLLIHEGSFVLSSADDAMKGNDAVTINGGNINITQCYEGISGNVVTINGGTIHIHSTDDGISVGGKAGGSGGDGDSSDDGPPPAMKEIFDMIRDPDNTDPLPCPIQEKQQQLPLKFSGGTSSDDGGPGGWGSGQPPGVSSHDYVLTVNGGYIYIDSGYSGDGIDSNGHIMIRGGTVIVNGPQMLLNGAFDTEGNFTVTGGAYALGIGSNGMAQSPSSVTSTQLSVRYVFDEKQKPGTVIHMESQTSGQVMFTFVPTKDFQSFVFTSPDLVTGETYDIFVGGSVDGTNTDGLYQEGSYYTPGTKVADLTLTDMVTNESNGFDQMQAILFSGCNFQEGSTSAEPSTGDGSTEGDSVVSEQSGEEPVNKAGTYFIGVSVLATAALQLF